MSRSLSNSGHDADYPSLQAKKWQPDVDEAHELADKVYRSISSKSQQIIDNSARIKELERENGILTERLRYEAVMNGRAQQSKNEEIQSLKAKLEAITQAAAQLHAQQTAIIEEQKTKIEHLQQENVQNNLASCSISRSPRDGARGRFEHQPVIQSVPSKVSTPLSNAPPSSGLPDLPSRPRPSRRGRPASIIRTRASESSDRQVAESSDRQPAPNPSKPVPDQVPTKRVLHSMNSPIRSALAESFAPAIPDAVDSTPRTVVCEYEHDFDTNGVFYYMGRTADGGWENPAKTGRVAVYCEAGVGGQELLAGQCKEDVLERGVRGDAGSGFAFAQDWFAVWLGDGTRLAPSHYTIRNGGAPSGPPTAWILEGSADGGEGSWVELDRRDDAPCFRVRAPAPQPAAGPGPAPPPADPRSCSDPSAAAALQAAGRAGIRVATALRRRATQPTTEGAVTMPSGQEAAEAAAGLGPEAWHHAFCGLAGATPLPPAHPFWSLGPISVSRRPRHSAPPYFTSVPNGAKPACLTPGAVAGGCRWMARGSGGCGCGGRGGRRGAGASRCRASSSTAPSPPPRSSTPRPRRPPVAATPALAAPP